jgi:hypothetical protein
MECLMRHWLVMFAVVGWALLAASAGNARPMTVREEIGIAYFGDPNTDAVQPITLSPDGLLAAVHTTRGDLAENSMQDEVRVFDLNQLHAWLTGPAAAAVPKPLITVKLGGSKEGPVITKIRWFPNSRGLAFLAKTDSGRERLWVASLDGSGPRPLTPPDQPVDAFDIHDSDHFVYTVRAPSAETKAMAHKPGIFAEEGLLEQLMAADPADVSHVNRLEIWAACGGPATRINDSVSGKPLVAYGPWAGRGLRLSPDGRKVLIVLPVRKVPEAWTATYAQGAYGHVTPGVQDLSAAIGSYDVTRNVVLDLATGAALKLGDGPTATTFGWQEGGLAEWSPDGREAVLEGAFDARTSSKPCIAAFDTATGLGGCVTPLPENAYLDFIQGLQFEDDRGDRIGIRHCRPVASVCRTVVTHYEKRRGSWRRLGETSAGPGAPGANPNSANLEVRQSMSERPVLWANLGPRVARPVWDPNPQLDGVELGRAETYAWTDRAGKRWVGGLYLPPDYKAGTRYPLVVQTHGFSPLYFRPSGSWPEGFAARELAASGIVVLQVPDCPNVYSGDPDEATCHEEMYRAAITQLSDQGIVDAAWVGITGFSRSVLYVMDLLARKTFPVRAALATDGVNGGYFPYVLTGGGDPFDVGSRREVEKWIGAPPWGPGLKTWMARSPEFNLDKIDAPLMLVAARPGFSLLTMWEPYSILTSMNKPVELLRLHTTGHPTWQPAARYASQQGAVDWFRFWLQGYEDPDPVKAAQYARWRKLRAEEAVQGAH